MSLDILGFGPLKGQMELTEQVNPNTLLLFRAIVEDSMEHLELALHRPDTHINQQNILGETALFLSLRRKRASDFIMRLVQAGCNVNIPTKEKLTPLHLAIARPSVDIAHELIKRGADVNAQEESSGIHVGFMEHFNKKTPLHYAVQYNNLEAICMLLYYEADVYITNINNMTPLKFAIYKSFVDVAEVLIYYYDELYFKHRPVLKDFNSIASWSDPECEGIILLKSYLEFNYNSALFKLLWSRINHQNLVDTLDLEYLLITYIRNSCFVTVDWLEGLHLILELLMTNQHKNHYVLKCKFNKNFFVDLFGAFCRKDIEPNDRLSIINICLSLSAPVTRVDYENAHELYGFGDELEALIYANNRLECSTDLCTITTFILPIEAGLSKEWFYSLLQKYFHKIRLFNRERYELSVPLNYFLNLLGYYSLPDTVKQKIKTLCQNLSRNGRQQIFEKLDRIPEFPSLFELCRNQIRKNIIGSSKVKYPYQFHDNVKKLNFPYSIHDVIRFKMPIYSS